MLAYLSEEVLEPLRNLGYHLRIWQADGTIFGCATTRPRIAIVAFRDEAALERFGNGPRPTHTSAGVPLSSIIDASYNDTFNSPEFIWLRNKSPQGMSYMHQAAHASSQVVGTSTSEVMGVRTKANATYTPQGNGGTYVCVHDGVASQRERLSDEQLQKFVGWFAHDPDRPPIYRRLHPTEELRAMSWRDHEMPPAARSVLASTATSIYSAISEALCPNVFEAIAARMLWAMGKTLPPGTKTEEALPAQVKRKRSTKSGIEYFKLVGLKASADETPLSSGEDEIT
jgi:site-specific DNA-cytosine methylase